MLHHQNYFQTMIITLEGWEDLLSSYLIRISWLDIKAFYTKQAAQIGNSFGINAVRQNGISEVFFFYFFNKR